MSRRFDVLIRGARVIDGTGHPWRRLDVGVQGDRIAAMEPPGLLEGVEAAETVDGVGRFLCPGFIDIQSHSIGAFMRDGRSLSKVTQGVTTEIMGELWTPAPYGGRRKVPFGWGRDDPDVEALSRSWSRFHHWLDHLAERGVSVNFGSFLGGGTVREWACGWDAAPPGADALEEMRRVTAQAMDDGAFGVATALIYPPNSYSGEEELIEVAREAGRRGGIYVTHLRSEGDQLLEATEELLRLSAAAEVPVEIYHLKATGAPNWPKMPRMIERIEQARAGGIDVTADLYPYIGSGTGLTVMLPQWAEEGGNLYEKLADPGLRARMRAEMLGHRLEGLSSTHTVKRDYVVPVGFRREENRRFIGRNLEEIAAEMGVTWADAVLELLASEGQRIATFFFTMSEENLRLELRRPWVKISTDAGGIDPATAENPVHPRTYGTYPRVLGRYVRDERVLGWEEAVRIMSGAVADRLGLHRRGELRPGWHADLVLFDPETVGDRATFTDPHRLSVGIEQVWVNGVRVLRDGRHTGALPGRPLYGTGRRS